MTEATDIVYDRNIADEKLKHGTKYERLAAFVFKLLDEESTVIHDLRLRGQGKMAVHQIDVTIERPGQPQQRLIVECRDKDDGNKIGQGEVRDFATVVRTLEATGLMLTTTGYTKGARDVAHDEGIDLGLLTAFEEHDWDGRVQQINVQLRMQIPSHIEATLGATDPGENLDMKVAVPGNTVIRRPDGMTDLAAVVRDALGQVALEDDGPVEIERELPEGTFIDLPTGSMAIRSVVVRAHMAIHVHDFTIGPPGVAELVYRALDGSVDRVVFDKIFAAS